MTHGWDRLRGRHFFAAMLAGATVQGLPSAPIAAQSRQMDSAGVTIVLSEVPANGSLPFSVNPRAQFDTPIDGASRIVGAFRFASGKLLLGDAGRRRLTFLTADGRVRGHLGGPGQAPGGFDAIQAVVRGDAGEALVWDAATRRLSRIDSLQRLRGSTQFEGPRGLPRGVISRLDLAGRLASGDVVAVVSPAQIGGDTSGHYRHRHQLMRYDRTGRFVQPILSLDGGEYYVYRDGGPIFARDVPFAPQTTWAVGRESIFVSEGTSFSIREYAISGRLERILRVRRSPMAVTPGMVARSKATAITEADPRFRPAVERMVGRMRYPATAAGYTSLHVDQEGLLWARRFANETDSTTWDIFEPSGTLIGGIRLPSEASLLYADESTVVLLSEDGGSRRLAVHERRPTARVEGAAFPRLRNSRSLDVGRSAASARDDVRR